MSAILQLQPFRPKYDFDAMRHGDAIEVKNKKAAWTMFARWRRKTGRQARLISSRDFPNLMHFIDSDIV